MTHPSPIPERATPSGPRPASRMRRLAHFRPRQQASGPRRRIPSGRTNVARMRREEPEGHRWRTGRSGRTVWASRRTRVVAALLARRNRFTCSIRARTCCRRRSSAGSTSTSHRHQRRYPLRNACAPEQGRVQRADSGSPAASTWKRCASRGPRSDPSLAVRSSNRNSTASSASRSYQRSARSPRRGCSAAGRGR